MARKRLPPDDPREWRNRAHSNLACGTAHIPEAYLEDLCFNAQQAADELSPFAIVTRYPGRAAPVAKRIHRRAVRIAAAVLRWAERQVGGP